ncbi:MAG TPA: hypothetical protein VG899_07480 [Mycobacteriales bacterium]|nr:hypothetical protein [Mycobacteriales bacterium]
MTGKVFLHIGEPKCGTTFLQDVLFRHRDALAAHHITIPGVDISDHYRAAQDVLEATQDPDDPGGLWAGSWEALAKVARTNKDTSIITHELICGANDAQAARAIASLQPAEVHVVLTARDLAGLLPAEWQETVKHRNSRTWEQWLVDVIDTPPRRRRLRARWFWSAHSTVAILQRWAALVGPERVHLVTVPPSSAGPDVLWHRFAQVIGAGDVELALDEVRSNQSLGVVEVEMLRRLNERVGELPLWFYARNVKGNLAHGLLAELSRGEKLQIPVDRQEWVRTRSRQRIRRIKSLGVDVVGDLGELAAPKEFRTSRQPSDVTDDEVLTVALDVLGTTIERRYERAVERSRMRLVARHAAPRFLRYVPTKAGRDVAWRMVHKIGRPDA